MVRVRCNFIVIRLDCLSLLGNNEIDYIAIGDFKMEFISLKGQELVQSNPNHQYLIKTDYNIINCSKHIDLFDCYQYSRPSRALRKKKQNHEHRLFSLRCPKVRRAR